MAEDWVSLREFGRRHDLSLAAVQKAIETGRVTAVKRHALSGRLKAIDAIAAAAQWNANTDPAEAAKNGKTQLASDTPREETAWGGAGQGVAATLGPETELALSQVDQPPGGKPPGGESEPAAPGADKDPHGYYAARAARERINAAQQQLDYSKALGQLVSVAEVKQLSSRRYRAIRDRVLNIPDRVAAVLAAERDPAQVHATLTAELKRVLHELSDDARAEAAGGVAVGVAA